VWSDTLQLEPVLGHYIELAVVDLLIDAPETRAADGG
jgi:hypothetical protein